MRMPDIKALALDIDGVLTDGTFQLGSDGSESKRLSFVDVMGISIGRQCGLRFALISGEGGPLVDRIAAKLQIDHVYGDCKDKASALRTLAENLGLDLGELCFVGDDINDLPALRIAGLAAAPRSARPEVLAEAEFVSSNPGGGGAVRDIIDFILKKGSPQ